MKKKRMPIIVLDNVDLKLLLKQKQALLKCNMPEEEKNGLLNLLDAMHDMLDPIR